MLAVMFVVVGVIAGVFTTTESAAAAVVWSLCVGLFIYKGFSFKDIPHIFANVVETLGKVLILLGVSGAFTYLLTYLQHPHHDRYRPVLHHQQQDRLWSCSTS